MAEGESFILDDSSENDDEDLAFANLNLKGVDFDVVDECTSDTIVNGEDLKMIKIERQHLFYNVHQVPIKDELHFDPGEVSSDLLETSRCLDQGEYVTILRGKTASSLFAHTNPNKNEEKTLSQLLITSRQRIVSYCTTLERCVELQMIGVAALNLFLQLNYTGPSLEKNLDSTAEINTKESILAGIDPHPLFSSLLRSSSRSKIQDSDVKETSNQKINNENMETIRSAQNDEQTNLMNQYHNNILSYLAVDGEWPCQVCENPYFLLISRIILGTLVDPIHGDWSNSVDVQASSSTHYNPLEPNNSKNNPSPLLTKSKQISSHENYDIDLLNSFISVSSKLNMIHLWNARAVVAHQRLLQCQEPSLTLWKEVEESFQHCINLFCFDSSDVSNIKNVDEDAHIPNITEDEDDITNYHNKEGIAARIMLEWGLAQHHFDREGKGKVSFQKSREYSGVKVEVLGAKGKRTKFQRDAKAQMLVNAFSTAPMLKQGEDGQNTNHDKEDEDALKKKNIKAKEIQHDEEEILLDRVQFENEKYNISQGKLNVLDQAILLAFCLDVKNENPMDGLTAEQMGGYLERVLIEHDDWMIYSTGLLERAWLECERVHGRERAILQIQALVDQHTNRLTITQSTFKSVEDSAPVQDRLRNIHSLVYPPRWEVMKDLAERYAKLGVVTTAAEIFEDLEMWDEVVECYTHAGKASKAEEVVRKRLSIAETPRMWVALGDLTEDPQFYEKAIELSKGKFAVAFFELGKHVFKKGDLMKASKLFQEGLEVKPLTPHIWFLLGTTNMQIGEWESALHAFSEVVIQEPEEGDAWANIAAVHMHHKNPSKAYPAIIESLKQNRNNWRVWINKLYTCIDLNKIDEAVQACLQLIEFRSRKNAAEKIPDIEEKCVRAIVGKSVLNYEKATGENDKAAVDATKRTLVRVDGLLSKISTTSESKSWIWEVRAFLDENNGKLANVYDHSMKEYRSILSVSGWETNPDLLAKMCKLVRKICDLLKTEGSRPNLIKSKMMVKGVMKKIQGAYFDASEIPPFVNELDTYQKEIEALLNE